MSHLNRNGALDKFRRFRAAQRQRGMRLLRIWVLDTRTPGFRQEARRQAALLRDAPEEREALGFIEEAADLGEADATR
jgi:hypothetical protein